MKSIKIVLLVFCLLQSVWVVADDKTITELKTELVTTAKIQVNSETLFTALGNNKTLITGLIDAIHFMESRNDNLAYLHLLGFLKAHDLPPALLTGYGEDSIISGRALLLQEVGETEMQKLGADSVLIAKVVANYKAFISKNEGYDTEDISEMPVELANILLEGRMPSSILDELNETVPNEFLTLVNLTGKKYKTTVEIANLQIKQKKLDASIAEAQAKSAEEKALAESYKRLGETMDEVSEKLKSVGF